MIITIEYIIQTVPNKSVFWKYNSIVYDESEMALVLTTEYVSIIKKLKIYRFRIW